MSSDVVPGSLVVSGISLVYEKCWSVVSLRWCDKVVENLLEYSL